jgi:hypothetical protein
MPRILQNAVLTSVETHKLRTMATGIRECPCGGGSEMRKLHTELIEFVTDLVDEAFTYGEMSARDNDNEE